MSKTLVIILSETRAHELTFENFKKNVIDELQADLCLCIGVTSNYDYNNPFYRLAEYKFTYDEPDDFGDAFDYAYNKISIDKPKYEILHNYNALHGKINTPKQSSDTITYYGEQNNINDFDDNTIVIHTKDFPNEKWRNQVYGNNDDRNNIVKEDNVITYKKPLHWRTFLRVKDQFLGGIKDDYHQHPGSAGILIFFRWFLLENLKEQQLLDKYDRFIITRSDFLYQLPHPNIEYMDEKKIWIPDGEHYGGYTDRHVILSKNNIEPYLNILNKFVMSSNDYYMKMKDKYNWNLEQVIKFHLQQNNVIHFVNHFPYIMFSVRNMNGTTRWSSGYFSSKLGYFIKYKSEYDKSIAYKKEFIESSLSIDAYYRSKNIYV